MIRIDTGIFDANQAAVGLLPPDEAYFVALTYKLLKNLDREYDKIRGGRIDVTNLSKSRLVAQANAVEKQVAKAISGIAATARMKPDLAKTILEVGEPEVPLGREVERRGPLVRPL